MSPLLHEHNQCSNTVAQKLSQCLCYNFLFLHALLVITLTYFPISLDNPHQNRLLVITYDTYADSPLLLYSVSSYKPYALLT